MDANFIVHLASNGSRRLHPDNHSSAFTNVLHEPIRLDTNDDYEVALVNVHIPKEYYIISEDDVDCYIELFKAGKENESELKGVCRCNFNATNVDIHYIIDNLNKSFKEQVSKISILDVDDIFFYSSEKNRVFLRGNIVLTRNGITHIKFSSRVAHILGFEDHIRYRLPKVKRKQSDQILEAPFRVGISDNVQYVVVYTDIVKASHFADQAVNILDIFTIGVDGNRGFHNVIYKPLNTNTISEISIKLADQEGRPILFKKNSGVTCSLCIRKRI